MVPAFKHVIQHPSNQPLPANARHLTTHPQGVMIASGTGETSGHCENKFNPMNLETTDGDMGEHPDTSNTTTVGIHFPPDEFVQQALKIGHPSRLHLFFPCEMEEVVKHYLRSPPHKLALERTEEIKRWIDISKSTAEAEKALKSSMSERRRVVLSGKNLTLFKQLLEEAGHGDRDLVEHLAQGFDLTGSLPESQVFARKVRPAAISCNELRRIADLSREGMIQTVTSSGDPELDDQLFAATLKEVDKGFLVGPLDPNSLPPSATLTRRFGVKQKSKTRPIDDYKASFVNSSVSQTETATVHTIDHIASLIACILRFSECLDSQSELNAKTWDLADAYKQIPLSDHAFEQDAYLVVYCPQKRRAEVFQQRVLPFGSVASVTAFLRVAHGIWKLGARHFKLMWTSYFDDFFSVTSTSTARHTDLIISSMFCLLGWKLSSDKLIDYSTVFKVLGVEFDLTMSGSGLSAVSNTVERVRELSELLAEITSTKTLKRADGERLRGRLQFASGQLFGRKARNNLRSLSKHIASGRHSLDDSTSTAVEELRDQLLANAPRIITGPMSDHVHIYVDASFDLDGYSGVGGVMYSSTGTVEAFFSEQVPRSFLLSVMQTDQQTMIQELEMLALLIAIELWCPTAKGHRIVAFTDSESVRGSFLKTWSSNEPSNKFLKRIFLQEEEHSCYIWLERVPSQSNPSDELSRRQVAQWKGLNRTRVEVNRAWCHSAMPLG